MAAPGVLPVAHAGFADAARYDRARPEYPPPALETIVKTCNLSKDSIVLDLGAGTGKFTKLLVQNGLQVVAVEPVAEMRAKCQENLPAIPVKEGSATALPAADASIDALCAAQAFHWFATPAALAEFHRALKPGGWLVLIWNRKDEEDPVVHEIEEHLAAYEKGTPRYRDGKWRQAFANQSLFSAPQEFHYINPQQTTQAGVLERALSISFLSQLPAPEKEKVKAEVAKILAKHGLHRADDPFVIRYVTDLYLYRKQG